MIASGQGLPARFYINIKWLPVSRCCDFNAFDANHSPLFHQSREWFGCIHIFIRISGLRFCSEIGTKEILQGIGHLKNHAARSLTKEPVILNDALAFEGTVKDL